MFNNVWLIHHIGPIGGFLVQNRGLEGENLDYQSPKMPFLTPPQRMGNIRPIPIPVFKRIFEYLNIRIRFVVILNAEYYFSNIRIFCPNIGL